jgi:hypothetical protein
MYSDMMCRLAARVMIVELDARVILCCTDRGSKDKCERLFFRRNACMKIGSFRYDSRRLFL